MIRKKSINFLFKISVNKKTVDLHLHNIEIRLIENNLNLSGVNSFFILKKFILNEIKIIYLIIK